MECVGKYAEITATLLCEGYRKRALSVLASGPFDRVFYKSLRVGGFLHFQTLFWSVCGRSLSAETTLTYSRFDLL